MHVRTDGRATRWDAHRHERRARLVDAALTAIRTHGAGLGMDDVAAVAGTSKTVVYRHFTDRTQLYLAVCERVAADLAEQVRIAMESADGPRAMTFAGIDAYLSMIESDPEVYRFVVHRPLVDRSVHGDPVTDLVSLIGDRVAAVVAARLHAAGADTTVAGPWGHGVVGMVRAAADHWIAGGGGPGGMSREALAAHLTDLAWSGLSGLPVPPKES
ncbi:MAG: TetR family transcriptional regulator [Pseudonocardia sp.]